MDFQSKRYEYIEMGNYYYGQQAIITDYVKINERANTKSCRNYIAKFVDNETSFICGIPLNYISKTMDIDSISDIEYNLSQWSKKHDIDLVQALGIYRESVELYYIDYKNDFQSIILNPSNSYVVKDAYGNIELLMYSFKKDFDFTNYIDIYTKDTIYHYKENITKDNKNFTVADDVEDVFVEVAASTPNIFGEVPCSVGNIDKTVFDRIKSCQDEFNILNSDQLNLGSDLRYFYMILYGVDPTDEKNKTMIQNINQNSIMFLNGEAKLDKLEKTINDSFMQNVRQNCKSDMFELVGHLNFNDSPTSNTSGEQIISRMIELKFRCNLIGATLQNMVRERVRFLFKYLKIKENKEYDWKSINIKITLNIPKEWLTLANVISQLSNTNVLSKETMRSILPLDHSPEIEKRKVELERLEDEKNNINLDKVGNVSTGVTIGI